MTVLTPANAFPNLAFPQHLSGQTKTVTSYTYPGAVWPKATGPAVLSYTNAFPGFNNQDLARTFNGSSDLIALPSGININIPLSASAWMFPTTFASNPHIILWLENSPFAWGIYLAVTTGHFGFEKGGLIDIDSGVAATLNTWQHVLWTVQSDNKPRLYINGTLVFTSTDTQALTSESRANSIGAQQGAANLFAGDLSDIAVWNTNISTGQISNLAGGDRANTIGANGNLVGYWPVTGSSPEPDFGPYGYNGTLTGTGITTGPPGLGLFLSGGPFPQHLSGQTNTVQNFLYPGAVQPQVSATTARLLARMLRGMGI